MKANIENKIKMTYCPPQIERIRLDNEISLVLQSDSSPDGDPNWSKASENFNNNPFKTNLG